MKLHFIPISSIVIDEERHRKGLGDDEKKAQASFEELKRSIEKSGLINPIRVSSVDNPLLLAGYRRLKAAEALGWPDVPATVGETDLSDLDKQIIELDENLARLDLSWHERVAAISRIDKLRTAQDPTWTQQRTADQLGLAQSKVSEANNLDMMIKLFPEIKKAPTKKAALSMAKHKAKTTVRRMEVVANPAQYSEVIAKVTRAKAEEYIETMADGAAGRLILTDPPFGIDYDKKPAGDGAHESYDDSPEAYRKLVVRMAPHLYRTLPNDGFLVWFLAHDHFDFCKEIFKRVGFAVDPVPLVWDRSDGRTYSVRPDRWFGKGYDIALHCIKGNPELIVRSRPNGNVFRYKPVGTADKEHIVERPVELYAELIRCMTLPGEKVTDFFGGSGSVAAAAASLGRDHFTVEMNPNHIPTIIQKVFNHTATKVAKEATPAPEPETAEVGS